MEILKETKLLDDTVSKIIQQLENEILEKIANLEKEDEELETSDIQTLKSEISKEENCYFDLILEKILNYYLNELKELNIKEYFEKTKGCYINDEWKQVPENYYKAERLIDDIMECCDPCNKYANVYEDAEYIASSLMRKKFNINGLEISEPLKIEYIKLYSVSSSIPSKELDSEIWYMVLYIAAHYYVLKSMLQNKK